MTPYRKPTLRNRVGSILAGGLPRSVIVHRGRADRRGVALTFDDGPDQHTHEYLDLLDRLEVRATFFVLGAGCAARAKDLRAIVARGHEVASHGFTHKKFPALGVAGLHDELERTQRLLPPKEHGRPLVRPPGGVMTVRSVFECARAGYQTVMWSLDSDDCRTESSDVVVERVSKAVAGDIVLLHEGQSWTLAALPAIVEGLRARGLTPMTVSELL